MVYKKKDNENIVLKIGIENIIIISILGSIFWLHYQWYKNINGFIKKIFVVISIIIFLLIFGEHFLYIQKSKKYNALTYENINELLDENSNRAMRLFNNITKHPIIASPEVFML